jgi:hypothetical protein
MRIHHKGGGHSDVPIEQTDSITFAKGSEGSTVEVGLTDTALDVMTKMGRFVYYKLQSEVLHLVVGSEALACEDGDYYVFADGVTVSIVEGKLH